MSLQLKALAVLVTLLPHDERTFADGGLAEVHALLRRFDAGRADGKVAYADFVRFVLEPVPAPTPGVNPKTRAERAASREKDRRAALELEVVVDGRGKPPRGTVFIPFFDEARLVNQLTLDAMDNISKEPDYKKCAVRIERATV